jgi:hypothetical protein
MKSLLLFDWYIHKTNKWEIHNIKHNLKQGTVNKTPSRETRHSVWVDNWIYRTFITASNITANLNTEQITKAESRSQSEFIYVLATNPLRLTISNFYFQLNTCFHSYYKMLFLLQLLLALASTVILFSDSRGTRDISLFQIRDSLNLEGQVPVFISPRNRLAQLYSQALGSLFIASYN